MLDGMKYKDPRKITTHKVNECNDAVDLIVMDGPGPGGASYKYAMRVNKDRDKDLHETTVLSFQNGPIGEVGTNGITNEALLAIVLDRLEGFQTGPYKCRENALAITKLEEAVQWLNHRTQARVARGVEGTRSV